VHLVNSDLYWAASSQGFYYTFGGSLPKRVPFTPSWAAASHVTGHDRTWRDRSSWQNMHSHTHVNMTLRLCTDWGTDMTVHRDIWRSLTRITYTFCHELRSRTGELTCIDDSDVQGYVEVCDYGHALNSILSWTLITNWYARITTMRRSARSCMTLQRRTERYIFFFMFSCGAVWCCSVGDTWIHPPYTYVYICLHIYTHTHKGVRGAVWCCSVGDTWIHPPLPIIAKESKCWSHAARYPPQRSHGAQRGLVGR